MKLFAITFIAILSVSSSVRAEDNLDEASYEDSVLRPAGEPQLIHASLPAGPAAAARSYDGTKTKTVLKHATKGVKTVPAHPVKSIVQRPIYQKPAVKSVVVKAPPPPPPRKVPSTAPPPVKRTPAVKRKPSILSVKQWHVQQHPVKRVQQFWAPQVPQVQLQEKDALRRVHWTAQRPMIWSRDIYPSYHQWYRDVYLGRADDTQQRETQEPEGQQQQEEIPQQQEQQEQIPDQQQQQEELPQQQEEQQQQVQVQQEEYGQEVKSGYY